MDFNNREISSYFWIVLFLMWSARNGEVRQSFAQLISVFCKPVIMTPLVLAAVYITGCIIFLEQIGVWTTANIKTSILWALSFAFATILDINRISDDRAFFTKTAREAFAITGVLTFIVEFYAFSLPVELVAVPCIAFIGMLHTVSERNAEHKPVKRVLEYLLTGAGTAYLGYSIYHTLIDLSAFATTDTAREFGLPIILTILFLPFLWMLILYSVYERTFMGLEWSIKNPRLRRWAKWRAIMTFGPKLMLLNRWAQLVGRFHPNDHAALKLLFKEIKALVKREKNPPIVQKECGWSPYKAKDFLKPQGLSTRDYHRSFENEWGAGSNYFEIGEGILPNNLGYYLNGNEHAVTELKLVLNVNVPENSDEAENKFFEICRVLLAEALDKDAVQSILAVLDKEVFDFVLSGKQICRNLEKWHGGIPGGYSRTMSVRAGSGHDYVMSDHNFATD